MCVLLEVAVAHTKRVCERKARGEVVLAETAEAEKQLQVYEDFGDVQYTVCHYAAFASWWTKRVNTQKQQKLS